MATESNNTAERDRQRLSEASLEGCYLESLLEVLASIFEDIDGFCDHMPAERYDTGWIRSKARLGLNLTYMAQAKAGAVKRLTDDTEKELWLAERKRRAELPAGRA